MKPEQVTDAMVEAVRLHFEMRSDVDVPIDIPEMLATAINASGYVLVPREPTEAMQRAGGHVNSEWLNDDAPIGEETTYTAPMRGVWKAMLAAAPTAVSSEREADHD